MSRSRGSSLGEVLIAIFLITVPLLALISSYGAQMRAKRNDAKREIASKFAASELSRVERKLWTYFEDDVVLERQAVPDEPGFEFEVQQKDAPASLKHVAVKVFWSESGRDLNLELETKFIQE